MTYDPYDVQYEAPKGSDYDPYDQPLVRKKFEPTLRGAEERFAIASPTAYAAAHVAMDMIPFAKYLLPSERDVFTHLSSEEQNRAIAFEGIGLGLTVIPALRAGKSLLQKMAWATIPEFEEGAQVARRVVQAVDFASKPTVRAAQRAVKLTPIEDIPQWKAFSWEETLTKRLTKKGFNEDEIFPIAQALSGDNRALTQLAFAKKTTKTAEGYLDVSKPLRESLRFKPGSGYVLDSPYFSKLSPDVTRQKHIMSQFYKNVKSSEVLGSSVRGIDAESAFRAMTRSVYGEEIAAKMSLAEASEEVAADLVAKMVANPAPIRSLVRVAGDSIFPSWMVPKRIVYGMHEFTHGAKTRVYDPIVSGFRMANDYAVGKVNMWNKMLVQRGLAKELSKGRYKVLFTSEDMQIAFKQLRKADDVMEEARRLNPQNIQAMREELKGDMLRLGQTNPHAAALIDTWYDYSDQLYGERSVWKIMDIFSKDVGLTAHGQTQLDALMSRLSGDIEGIFSTRNSQSAAQKMFKMKQALREVRAWASNEATGGLTFIDKGKKLEAKLTEAFDKLTYANPQANIKGSFLPYLENYAARIGQGERKLLGGIFQGLSGPRSFYTQQRVLPTMKELETNFEMMIAGRTRAQAKEMFLHRQLEKAAETAVKLPQPLREYTEHFLARSMGLPTKLDSQVAQFLEKNIGGVERFFGGTGTWDARRVHQLGQTINNFTYMGALGLKPFAAMANLFQTLISVPADLGGLRDFGSLARGVSRLMDMSPSLVNPKISKARELVNYLNDIGIITEFAPETARAGHFFPFGKTLSTRNFTIQLPRSERIRDFLMWMFQGSDRFNRYVTGAAAKVKWEAALEKMGGKITEGNLGAFAKASGINGRYSWKKAQLKDLLSRGKIEDAKAIFIRDVVADTQYLYGTLESPSIASNLGAVGRTGAIFQSWFMNYGVMIEKWMRVGTGAEKASRMAAWAVSSAIAYNIMREMWGSETAARRAFLGPFPSSVSTPPAWDFVGQALKTTMLAGNISFEALMGDYDEKDLQRMQKQVSKLGKSTTIFLPGGLQLSQYFTARERNVESPALAAILGYYRKQK